MRKIFLLLLMAAGIQLFAQRPAGFTTEDASRIIGVLASDEMRGRKAGTPEIDSAARFIAEEFRKAGLRPFEGGSYLQQFTMLQPRVISQHLTISGKEIPASDFHIITAQEKLELTDTAGYIISTIGKNDDLFGKAMEYARGRQKMLIMVNSSFRNQFPRLVFLKRQILRNAPNIIFILGDSRPGSFSLHAEHSFRETEYANVVGILPGRSRESEMVIFSAHYDHIGVGRPVNGDSIFNGANDNAAGTTAVMMLARHFATANIQERTLVFVAFTAEEIGGFGSQYFSRALDPGKVAAMINIEMIGTPSRWGRKSAFITGFAKSNLGSILQRNLKGSGFNFYPDPYPDQNLFYRSDNATLAALGVPAHTVSTARMEDEPHYHKVSDEIQTLDLDNMVEIIRAIAISSKGIVEGRDTPGRIRPEK